MSGIIRKRPAKILCMSHMKGSALSFSQEAEMIEVAFMERVGPESYLDKKKKGKCDEKL